MFCGMKNGEEALLFRPAGIYDNGEQPTFFDHQVARNHARPFISKVSLVNCRKGRPFCIPSGSRLNKHVEETFETGREQMRI
jgi:hypothetical protein